MIKMKKLVESQVESVTKDIVVDDNCDRKETSMTYYAQKLIQDKQKKKVEEAHLDSAKETLTPTPEKIKESYDVKSRKELTEVIEKLKKNNYDWKIRRSKKEGYRYLITTKKNLKEDYDEGFCTVFPINDKGEPLDESAPKDFRHYEDAEAYQKELEQKGIKSTIECQENGWIDDQMEESLKEDDKKLNGPLAQRFGKMIMPQPEKKRPRYAYEVYWYDNEEWNGDPIFKNFWSKKAQEKWYEEHKNDPDKFGMFVEDGYNVNESLKDLKESRDEERIKYYQDKLDKIGATPEEIAKVIKIADDYEAKATKSFISFKQMDEVADAMGLKEMSDKELNRAWDLYYYTLTKEAFSDEEGSLVKWEKYDDAASAFAEVINREARERKAKGNYKPKEGESLNLEEIIGDDFMVDSDGLLYLSKDTMANIVARAKDIGMSFEDLMKQQFEATNEKGNWGSLRLDEYEKTFKDLWGLNESKKLKEDKEDNEIEKDIEEVEMKEPLEIDINLDNNSLDSFIAIALQGEWKKVEEYKSYIITLEAMKEKVENDEDVERYDNTIQLFNNIIDDTMTNIGLLTSGVNGDFEDIDDDLDDLDIDDLDDIDYDKEPFDESLKEEKEDEDTFDEDDIKFNDNSLEEKKKTEYIKLNQYDNVVNVPKEVFDDFEQLKKEAIYNGVKVKEDKDFYSLIGDFDDIDFLLNGFGTSLDEVLGYKKGE